MNLSLYRNPAASERLAVGLILLAVTVVPLSLVSLSGCRKSDRPKTVKVDGVVTFAGKAPEYPGALFFAPLEVAAGYPRRGGRALFDTNGKYAATSFDEGDGLVPGTYRVRVESWKRPPAMGSPGISYVPKGFAAPDLVVTEQEGKIQFDLDVASP